MRLHCDPKKARKSTPRSAPEGLQPASLLSPASADPNVLIMNNSVLTSQFDPNLLQPGLVSQAILPGTVSGTGCGWPVGTAWALGLTTCVCVGARNRPLPALGCGVTGAGRGGSRCLRLVIVLCPSLVSSPVVTVLPVSRGLFVVIERDGVCYV